MAKNRNTTRHLTKKRAQQNQNRKKRNKNQRNLKIQLHVSQDDWGNIQTKEIAMLSKKRIGDPCLQVGEENPPSWKGPNA